MNNRKLFKLILAIFVMIGMSAHAAPMLINGAGASFPYPLYAKWISKYRTVDQSTQINYQSIGSGGGIRQFLKGTTDFGASDAPMKDKELAKSKSPVLHIPTTIGAVTVTYNVPGVQKSLNLSGDVVAKIFMGQITKWNDKAITKLNPKAKLPNTAIVVCRRADGSGTTSIFTDFLSKVSADWKSKIGKGKVVKWPTGIAGKGNEGVTALVKQNPGAIGYIELTYALKNKLPVAGIQNQSGEFVTPTVKSVSMAAAGALKSMPEDFRVSITNPKGKGAYAIASFTYLLVHQKMDQEKGQKIVKFLKWALDDGQKHAEPLFYAPLPKGLISKVNAKIDSIVFE